MTDKAEQKGKKGGLLLRGRVGTLESLWACTSNESVESPLGVVVVDIYRATLQQQTKKGV